eukprot:gnl/MRDRNA2_/MRDRNA2_63770_c0_seq1.p1 gnl/MRDRNA2_/MRDRNA2_63770_c0~~gnl/MRDRNA2_/MRDRNA2_63770_c0_seq1.p1  ORF type:complete len:194 (-),score=38.26 gnl/MRDRNA2_/MRDRNA2_63770_c0_seq1:112-693(-)
MNAAIKPSFQSKLRALDKDESSWSGVKKLELANAQERFATTMANKLGTSLKYARRKFGKQIERLSNQKLDKLRHKMNKQKDKEDSMPRSATARKKRIEEGQLKEEARSEAVKLLASVLPKIGSQRPSRHLKPDFQEVTESFDLFSAQAFADITSVPAAALIGLLIARGVIFAMTHFRCSFLTTGKEPLLAIHS